MCIPIEMEVTLCLIILTFIVWESISIRLEVSLDVWILKRFHQMTLIENTTKSDGNDSTKKRWTVGRKLPSINKCTGEIDVMEPLVETILTLVYSIIRATIKVHRWIQAPVHMHQWRFHIWGFKRWQRILESVHTNSEDMFRGSISLL